MPGIRKLAIIALSIFLVFDIGYSFFQHYLTSLDGDLAAIVLPAEWYREVLKDPFGIKAITGQIAYSGAGRFYAHWALGTWFKTVPLFLQNFLSVSPIDSVYLSSGIAKTIIQLGLILLLFRLVKTLLPGVNWNALRILTALALITIFFQTNSHFFEYGAIIDRSITYTFFYALPTIYFLLFITPSIKKLVMGNQYKIPFTEKLIMVLLLFIIPFSGPLMPPITILSTGIVLGSAFITGKLRSLNFFNIGILILFGMVGVYAFFVGQHNSENVNNAAVTLTDRYMLLGKGLFHSFLSDRGLTGILLLLTLINGGILYKYKSEKIVKQVYIAIAILAIFSLIYIFLLPLGGYREYRPLILRRDTLIPVTMALIIAFTISYLLLAFSVRWKGRKYYIACLAMLAIFLTIIERLDIDTYRCEKEALQRLANSNERHMHLDNKCYVMSWEIQSDTSATRSNTRLLKSWHVIEEDKLYYQTPWE